MVPKRAASAQGEDTEQSGTTLSLAKLSLLGMMQPQNMVGHFGNQGTLQTRIQLVVTQNHSSLSAGQKIIEIIVNY